MEQKILFLEMRFGDYIAIAKTNKAILDDNDDILKSQHGGYTDDEIYVPLIILKQYKYIEIYKKRGIQENSA